MQLLYYEDHFNALKKQISKRQFFLLLLAFVVLAAVSVTLILDDHKENRPVLLTTLLLIFGGGMLIFLWDMTVKPLRSYAKHVDSALHGRSHECTVVFDRVGSEDSVIGGLTFRDLIFLGEADKHGERERMFYWDMEIPLPDFRKGQELRLTYYDRFLTGYEVL